MPKQLLVVEDDLNVAKVLEARLQTFNYQVCGIARTGRAAIQAALEHRPDLILMDILLEGNLNGIEAAEAIQRQMDVPIVFLTCLNDKRIFDRALQANANGYILKPFNPTELNYTLQIALIKHAADRERKNLISKLEQSLAERKRIEEVLLTSNETLEQKVIERTRAEKVRTKQLQALAVELIEAEERERHRIAGLLHDDLQQMLAAARFQLQLAESTDPAFEKLDRILAESIAETRRLAHELSPPVLRHGNLWSALEWLARQMEGQFGLSVELRMDQTLKLGSNQVTVFIFRAAQELLFNTVKHSGVKSARIVVSTTNDSLKVIVSDKGRGFEKDVFDSSHTGLGLLTIRERALHLGGCLEIESKPGKGSRICLELPIDAVSNNK